jgi:hypothetical protein
METANVRKCESQDLLASSTQDLGSTGSFVAMVGCLLSLLMMLCACSHA